MSEQRKTVHGDIAKPCIDCRSTEKRERKNPYWCDTCDVKRCDRITASLESMLQHLENKSK